MILNKEEINILLVLQYKINLLKEKLKQVSELEKKQAIQKVIHQVNDEIDKRTQQLELQENKDKFDTDYLDENAKEKYALVINKNEIIKIINVDLNKQSLNAEIIPSQKEIEKEKYNFLGCEIKILKALKLDRNNQKCIYIDDTEQQYVQWGWFTQQLQPGFVLFKNQDTKQEQKISQNRVFEFDWKENQFEQEIKKVMILPNDSKEIRDRKKKIIKKEKREQKQKEILNVFQEKQNKWLSFIKKK